MFKKLLATAALLGAVPAFAAVSPNSFISPQTLNRGIVRFLQGTDAAGTPKTIYTAGTNGSRCYGVWSSNTDTSAAHNLQLQVTASTIGMYTVSITTVEGAGVTAGVPAQNLLSPGAWPGLPVDEYGNPYIQLISGDTLQAYYLTNLTAGQSIYIYASCSDF